MFKSCDIEFRLDYLQDHQYIIGYRKNPKTSVDDYVCLLMGDIESYTLTAPAKDYIESCENLRKQNAERELKEKENEAKLAEHDKRQKRHEMIVGIVSAIVGALVSLAVEHHKEIFSLLSELIQR